MKNIKAVSALTAFAIGIATGCGSQAQEQKATASELKALDTMAPKPSDSTPPKASESVPPKASGATSSSTSTEVTPDKDKEKEKRGNTPVGMDRSGGGPLSGAIVDPAGVVTKGR